MDRFRLAVVEDCRRKGPIHSSARIDVAAVVAHVRHRLLRIKIDRRRMTVDNVFRERSPVTKEAVANPKLGFGGLLVEGHARTNPRVNVITEFVFMAGRERTHPFLRSLKHGRCAQGGDGCIAAVGEEVCKVPFRFRRSKHELFVIAPEANSALGLEAWDDLSDLARVWATINVVAERSFAPKQSRRAGLRASLAKAPARLRWSSLPKRPSRLKMQPKPPATWEAPAKWALTTKNPKSNLRPRP